MSPELQAAVENAYSVFARHQPGTPLTVCTCQVCVSEENEHLLRTMALRDLPASLVFEYNNSCHDRDSAVAQSEQRYFLPRYLELISAGAGDKLHSDGTGMALSRLRDIGWRIAWPDREVRCIEQFFGCLMKDWVACTDVILRHSTSKTGRDHGTWHLTRDVDDILTLIEEAASDCTCALQTWDECNDPSAAIHMAYICREYLDPSLPNLEFYTRPEVQMRIEAAVVQAEDEPLRQILADGLEALSAHCRQFAE